VAALLPRCPRVVYTSPLYYQGRLVVPQAGLDICRLRCLDAAMGKLIWEARSAVRPVGTIRRGRSFCQNMIIYQFSTGRYRPQTWLFEQQSTFGLAMSSCKRRYASVLSAPSLCYIPRKATYHSPRSSLYHGFGRRAMIHLLTRPCRIPCQTRNDLT